MINMYGHSGSENHGCEAIVRSTCLMFGNQVRLYSTNPKQDINYVIDKICNLSSDETVQIKKGTIDWLISSIQTKLTGKYDLAVKYRHKMLTRRIVKNDIYLSIGGDNYCYAGADLLGCLNNCIRKAGAKTVLWGCSVEPSLLNNKEVAEDLGKFDLITARETISYDALKKVNINTVLVSDPAFTLAREDLSLPDGWIENNMIGINASPLILNSSSNKDIVLNAYRKLIHFILDNTECGIALIPHVVWENNDDRTILKNFYDEFKDTGRVIMIDDHNCMQLKGYIARCRMFIGARTHATIAAYSSCVPTLVLGYSVKSRGIAKDLFGKEEHYVVPVQQMTDDETLMNEFKWIMENEESIRDHLKEIMPEYINRAYIARDELNKL